MKNKTLGIILIFVLLSALGIIFFGFEFIEQKIKEPNPKCCTISTAKYPLLSPRVLIDNPNDILINFLDLRKRLKTDTEKYGDKFALYFEYLPTGTSIGINQNNEFYAASLFKVPVVMAYFRKMEKLGQKTDEEFIIQEDDIDKNFGNLWRRGAGVRINASDAIKLTLQESDNTAAKIIARQVDDDSFQEVYQGLDIDLNMGNGGAILTTKNYSSILKALYLSAVLNKDDSQKILDYMSDSHFNNMLVAGVSPKAKVAHKIGDYRDSKGNEAFMDCGIVYLPHRPYSLCMMSVGTQAEAEERMRAVSKEVYDFVWKVDRAVVIKN